MQDNIYNPFSPNSKKMIHDVGNVEHFELRETDPQVQCFHCLSCWAKGIEHCTCGICFCHKDAVRPEPKSISNYVIKKGCSHGVRHGKSEEQIYHHQADNAWKRCRKKRDAQVKNYTGILDLFLKSPRNCKLQVDGWEEAKCAGSDKMTQKVHTYKLTRSEYLRYPSNWSLLLNSSGSNAPMATRP